MNPNISTKQEAPTYNFRLPIKLVLVVIAIIVSVVAVLDFFFLPRLAESKIKRVEAIGTSLTKTISDLALTSMMIRKPAILSDSFDQLISPKGASSDDILQVSVITYPEGKYYASTTKQFVNRKAHNTLLLKLSQNKQDTTHVQIVNYKFKDQTIPALQFLKNIYYTKQGVQHHLATTQVLYNYNAIIQDTRAQLLGSAGIIILISILVVWVLILPISRGHNKLILALGEASESNYNFRLSPGNKDELSVLYQRYNQLMDHIQLDLEGKKNQKILNIKNGKRHKGNESIIRKSEITCLCSRIPDAQHRIEEQQPGEVVEFIREYLNSMEETVKENGGQIIKIFGDKVFAVFEGINSPDNAVRASLKLSKKWTQLNHEKKVLGKEELNYGIGVHSELGISGNFDLLFNTYSIISEVAKISDYLCTCAPKGEILISSGLLEKTMGAYQHQVARNITYTDVQDEAIFSLLPNQDLGDFTQDIQTNVRARTAEEMLSDDVKTDKIASELGGQSVNPERTFDSSLPDILEETLASSPLASVTEEVQQEEFEVEEEPNENLWGEFSDNLKSDS